ncbi:hypothetical protein [Aeromicrobium sp.]|uniref:hypothetical protein n=1 Tax=Aeromicrobium sp. TaxID=1871063 RepID=UPI003C4F2A09
MSEQQNAQHEAIQTVVDRVGAYQGGAPKDTVAEELRKGFAEADVEVSAEDVERLVQAIEAADGDVNVADVLG